MPLISEELKLTQAFSQIVHTLQKTFRNITITLKYATIDRRNIFYHFFFLVNRAKQIKTIKLFVHNDHFLAIPNIGEHFGPEKQVPRSQFGRSRGHWKSLTASQNDKLRREVGGALGRPRETPRKWGRPDDISTRTGGSGPSLGLPEF